MKMQLKNAHFYLMLLGDALLFTGALYLAYLFRFEFSLDAFFARQLRTILIPILLVKLCTFFLFGLYQGHVALYEHEGFLATSAGFSNLDAFDHGFYLHFLSI